MVWVRWALQFIHQVLTSKPCIDKLLSLSRLSFTDWWLLMKLVSFFSRLKFYYDVICADLPLLYFQNGKGFCQSFGRSWFVHSKQGSFVNVFVILLQAWSSSTSFTNPCHAAMFILCSCFAPRFICAAPCKYFWKHLGWSDRRGLLVRSDVGASLFHRRHFGSRQAAILFFAAKRREPILKGFVLVTFGDHCSKVPREVLERGRSREDYRFLVAYGSRIFGPPTWSEVHCWKISPGLFIFQVFGDANQTDGIGIPCFWVASCLFGEDFGSLRKGRGINFPGCLAVPGSSMNMNGM